MTPEDTLDDDNHTLDSELLDQERADALADRVAGDLAALDVERQQREADVFDQLARQVAAIEREVVYPVRDKPER